MTPEQFCYWLQGFAEITQCDKNFVNGPQPHEWKIIVDHLNLVFRKETPSYTMPALTSKEIQKKMEDVGKQIRDGIHLDPKWPHWPTGPLATC